LWTALAAAVALISVLPRSSAPVQAIASFGVNDKLLHFAAWAVLAFLPALWEGRRRTIVIVAAALLVSTAAEVAQFFVPGRAPDLADTAANSGGIICGAVAGAFRRSARFGPRGTSLPPAGS
jgi:VanZ family protein